MFGFLSPRPHSAEYRRYYARLCVHQRRWYGVRSLAFHSYEAVFLYQLLGDAAAYPKAVLPNQRCCKLARKGDVGRDGDAAAGKFAASFAVLLAGIKLDDDVRDSRSLPARGVKVILRGAIRQANEYLTRLDPEFPAKVRGIVADHHAIETPAKRQSLPEYAAPTASGFGYLFALAAPLHLKEAFREIGGRVGEAVVAYDAAVDWSRDRRRGEFNPLQNEEEVRDAVAFAADRLHLAAGLIRANVGPDSATIRTLTRVGTRVAKTDPFAATPAFAWRPTLTKLLARAFVPAPILAMAVGEPTGDWPGEGPGEDNRRGGGPLPPDGASNAAADAANTAANTSNCGNGCGSACDAVSCGCDSFDACDGCGNACDGCSGCDCSCG